LNSAHISLELLHLFGLAGFLSFGLIQFFLKRVDQFCIVSLCFLGVSRLSFCEVFLSLRDLFFELGLLGFLSVFHLFLGVGKGLVNENGFLGDICAIGVGGV